MLKYAIAWLLLMAAAIANGLIREKTYGRRMGELAAHQLSCFTGLLLLYGAAYWIFRLWPLESSGIAWSVGWLWLGMTIAFEFLFGHFVVGHSWGRLWADYNVLEGRFWTLVLLGVFFAPVVCGRLS